MNLQDLEQAALARIAEHEATQRDQVEAETQRDAKVTARALAGDTFDADPIDAHARALIEADEQVLLAETRLNRAQRRTSSAAEARSIAETALVDARRDARGSAARAAEQDAADARHAADAAFLACSPASDLLGAIERARETGRTTAEALAVAKAAHEARVDELLDVAPEFEEHLRERDAQAFAVGVSVEAISAELSLEARLVVAAQRIADEAKARAIAKVKLLQERAAVANANGAAVPIISGRHVGARIALARHDGQMHHAAREVLQALELGLTEGSSDPVAAATIALAQPNREAARAAIQRLEAERAAIAVQPKGNAFPSGQGALESALAAGRRIRDSVLGVS